MYIFVVILRLVHVVAAVADRAVHRSLDRLIQSVRLRPGLEEVLRSRGDRQARQHARR